MDETLTLNPMPAAWGAPGESELDLLNAEIEAERRYWEAEQMAEFLAEQEMARFEVEG